MLSPRQRPVCTLSLLALVLAHRPASPQDLAPQAVVREIGHDFGPVAPGGTVTFGGQTHPADGGAAMILATPERARELSQDPNIEISLRSYGQARATPVDLWSPPVWSRHLASLFTLIAFVLLAATYVPRNRIRRAVGHPMTAGVALWAFAHLMANGRLADLVLFGAFLVWAVLAFLSGHRRDRAAGTERRPGTWSGDLVALAVGLVLWALFAFQLHGLLFGVRPFA